MTAKPKAAALKVNLPVVKSDTKAKLPAVKAKREYFEFDAYAEVAQQLAKNGDDTFEGDVRNSHDDLMRLYREFDAGRSFFERDELYRTRKPRRQNLLGCWCEHEITRRVVSEKISLLIGSFPNAGPHNPETYMGMMIEEVIAANPSASALEATCRELRRTKNFAPSIAELLKELRRQAEQWRNVLGLGEDDIEYWQRLRARQIAEARGKTSAVHEFPTDDDDQDDDDD
jgi:hypothetical protein